MNNGDISIQERRQLLKGPVARFLLTTLNKSTAPFEWYDPLTDVLPSHGSMFFLRTGKVILGVTARHVYDAFLENSAANPRICCQINNMRFAPKERLLGKGREADVVTFELKPNELVSIERTTVPWPPSIPDVGDLIGYAGLPAIGKRSVDVRQVELGYYTAFGEVDSLSDRDISSVKPPNDQLIDIVGKGLPPPGYDLGGMSGGPVVALRLNEGLLSWAIAGIIYECHPTCEIVKAVRADVINADGGINS